VKVLFLLENELTLRYPGPTRVLNISNFLKPKHEVEIICKKSYLPLELNTGIMTVRGDNSGFFNRQLLKMNIFFKTLNRIFMNKPDVIVSRSYYYILLLKIMTSLFRIRLVYDMHCFRYSELILEGKRVKSFFVKIFEKFTHHFADNIIVVSKNLYDGLKRRNVILLPNGFNNDEFKKIGSDEHLFASYGIKKADKIVGFIGNIIEWVDVDAILKASEMLPKNVKILIIGNNSKVENLESMKKYKNVTFTGSLEHSTALKFLRRFDMCLLPYRKDVDLRHLSIRKTFEYLGAGKPIILSDSKIGEKEFIIEKKNGLYYQPGDPKDLSTKIKLLLRDKRLAKSIAKQNLRLSNQFTWKQRLLNSGLNKIIDVPHLYEKKAHSDTKISIIIKALNEQKHIAKSIESAIKALKGFKGEVILVDSLSTDKTVEIAKRYPIKIVQLKNPDDRCCGIGPQTGFLISKGDFVYILDGDMVLDKDFFKKALPHFTYGVAGVAGNIFERSTDNLAFQVRAKYHIVERESSVDQLGMGGLYSREALDKVGYFSNPYFYAYEEYDLGAKLTKYGYSLLRIPNKMIDHYGDEVTSFRTLTRRWKSRYLFGSGQYLRKSIAGKHFFRTFSELGIYILTLFWLLVGVASLGLAFLDITVIYKYLILTSFFLIILLLKKRNLKRTLFSLFSWNFQAIGMVVGFFIKTPDPKDYTPDIVKIK